MRTTANLLLNFMAIKTQLVIFVLNETCQKSKIRLECACSVSTEQFTFDALRHCRQLLTDDSYRKIPKISPSNYKPPKPVKKNPPLNRPSKYKPPGAWTWKIALKYKVKQSNYGNVTSNYRASPIDFETQISLCR